MPGRSRWVVGGALVLLGLVLLADNLGVLEVVDVWTVVPALVILWGLWSLLRHRLRRLFWPLLLVLVGGLWQLVELGRLTEAEAWSYWPAILVLLGLSMVFGRHRRTVSQVDGDHFEFLSVTSTVNGRPDTAVKAGDATAVFGDVTVDLRADPVAPPVELDAVAVFGDVTVKVPTDWDVATSVVSIFGEVAENRREPPARKSHPDLIIDGVLVFGDLEIRD